jgi:hypothetical protein
VIDLPYGKTTGSKAIECRELPTIPSIVGFTPILTVPSNGGTLHMSYFLYFKELVG